MSTMWRRLIEALLMISRTGSCFPRPGRALEQNARFEDASQTKTANGKPSTTSQPEHYLLANQQPTAYPYQTNLPRDHNHNHNPQALTRHPSSSSSSSSSSTTPASSLRSLPSTLGASLNRHISSWRGDHPSPWPTEQIEDQAFTSESGITASESSDDEDFIASLDALALSEHEREVLGRMQLVRSSARAARERRKERQKWSYGDDVEHGSCLRGGGDDEVLPFRTPRRRTNLPTEDPALPKADSYRPPKALWWLAGGRGGQVPTVGELRVRKEVERANRRRVGFWGTVLGVRRVGRVGILGDGDGGGGGGEGDGGGVLEGDVEAGSSHGSRSVGSIVGGSGAGGGGGSLASSRRERGLDMEHPVEAKAESAKSVANADDDPGHENEDMLDEPAEDHQSTKSGSVKDAGAEEPKASSESAESVANDHESTKSREISDAGIDEPKARSESAKSVTDINESTKARGATEDDVEGPRARSESAKSVAEDFGSTKSGERTDAGVEEPKAKSESAKSVAEEAARAEVESVRSRERGAETETENTGEEEPRSPHDG